MKTYNDRKREIVEGLNCFSDLAEYWSAAKELIECECEQGHSRAEAIYEVSEYTAYLSPSNERHLMLMCRIWYDGYKAKCRRWDKEDLEEEARLLAESDKEADGMAS